MGTLAAILSAIPGVEKLIKALFGSREARDEQSHDEITELYRQFSAEFGPRANRTWWDSLVDGLNRLPRPIVTFGVISLFGWCVVDPVGFSVAMQALALIPDQLWWLIFTVIVFWFGSKTLATLPSGWKLPPAEILTHIKEILATRKQTDDFADESKPLTDEAIKEWNEKNKTPNQ